MFFIFQKTIMYILADTPKETDLSGIHKCILLRQWTKVETRWAARSLHIRISNVNGGSYCNDSRWPKRS